MDEARTGSRSRRWRRLVSVGLFVVALAVPGVAQAGKWAVVDSAGTLVRGNGALSASHLRTGTYQVTFNASQANCAYVATPGDTAAGAVLEPAVATVATRTGNNAALFIQTFNQSTGALQDEPFHVQTSCGPQQIYAVVNGATGLTARGGHIEFADRLAQGQYEVVFDRNVSKCAFDASIGTTGTGSIPSPGQATVAGSPGNVNGVSVRIVDRLGNPLDSSYHLEVSCGSSKLIGVINANGTKARGANVVSSQKLVPTLNDGRYEVIFNRNVASCSYIASVGVTGNVGDISTPVTITTATRTGNANGVFVFVHKTDGTTLDEPFHLNVVCPPGGALSPAVADGSQDSTPTSPAAAQAGNPDNRNR